MGQTPKGTGAIHNHPSTHHIIVHFMKEVITSAFLSTMMLIHSHNARITPPTDIKGLARALQNRIVLPLISHRTAISVAMATPKTPTVPVMTIQTLAIGHKKATEDAITRNRDDKQATPTVLIRIVQTLQTTRTMEWRTAGINAHVPLINVRPLTAITALRDTNAHISTNRAIHPIPPHLADSEKTETNSNPNNSRVTMNSLITSLHTHLRTTGGRKSALRMLHRNGWADCQR
jgi:hypothetical protein